MYLKNSLQHAIFTLLATTRKIMFRSIFFFKKNACFIYFERSFENQSNNNDTTFKFEIQRDTVTNAMISRSIQFMFDYIFFFF